MIGVPFEKPDETLEILAPPLKSNVSLCVLRLEGAVTTLENLHA